MRTPAAAATPSGAPWSAGGARLREPLPRARIDAAACLRERRRLRAHLDAVLENAQRQRIRAFGKARRIERIDAGLHVERAQQLAPTIYIDTRIARQQQRDRRASLRDLGIHVGQRRADAHAIERADRQHREAEVAAERAREVAVVHAARLRVMLRTDVMAVVKVLQLDVAVRRPRIARVREVPAAADEAARRDAERARARHGQALVASPARQVDRLLVDQRAFRHRRRLAKALVALFRAQPVL